MSIVAQHFKNGIAFPSTTIVDGEFAVRAALFNHRAEMCGIEPALEAIVRSEGNYISPITICEYILL
jgi:aromatic-L-amino-acid/L-tryptophan decarboxylase